MLSFRTRLDLGAMAMLGFSAFPKTPTLLEPNHKDIYCHIQDSRWWGLVPLQRCSRWILQSQQTEQHSQWNALYTNEYLYIYIFIDFVVDQDEINKFTTEFVYSLEESGLSPHWTERCSFNNVSTNLYQPLICNTVRVIINYTSNLICTTKKW